MKIIKQFTTTFLERRGKSLVDSRTKKTVYNPEDMRYAKTKVHEANNLVNKGLKKFKYFATILELRDKESKSLLKKHIFLIGKVPTIVKDANYYSSKHSNQVTVETWKPVKNLKKLQSALKRMFEVDEDIRHTYMTLPTVYEVE